MRMWMIEPKILCRQHLLGEHRELHTFMGTLRKKISIRGYIRNNLLEVKSLFERHNKLCDEMKERGYNHKTPIDALELSNLISELSDEIKNYKIDYNLSLADLITRCPICKENYEKLRGGL